MKILGNILFVFGLMFCIGTVGALENASIGFTQSVIQAFAGLLMVLIGGIFIGGANNG